MFRAFSAGLCDLERRLEKAAAAAARSQYQHEVYEEAQAASKKKIDLLVEREGREGHRLEVVAKRKKQEASIKSLHKSISVDERREKAGSGPLLVNRKVCHLSAVPDWSRY